MKKMILFLLVLLLTAATGAWAQTTHTVKMKSGTKDAANWTIATGSGDNVRSAKGDATEGLTGVAKGDEVRLTYTGRLKVKSVTATHDGHWDGDLSNIPASAIASDGHTVIVPNGTTLTGTLDGETHPYKIVIPDGATVTLAGVTINGWHDGAEYASETTVAWAGITCEGNATIILADNSANTVKGFFWDYPGIYVTEGKKLTIKGGSEGTGSLTASPFDGGTNNSYGAGIGGGFHISCGNILIEGGFITAQAGNNAAGIGGGCGSDQNNHSRCGNITISGGTVKATGYAGGAGIGSGFNFSDCGNILISGGTVEATGGYGSAGIGSGYDCSSCGTVTITTDVTKVTTTKGDGSPNSIGAGNNGSTCGTVTIGGTVYYEGSSYKNGGDVYLTKSPLTLVNLGKLTGNYEAPNGTTLFGTLKGSEQPYKVSIADGATVTLDGATINGVNDWNCQWAGLECAGNATIILKDGTENTVKGFHQNYPGVFVPKDKTLTIKSGTSNPGKLTASPFDGGGTVDSYGAGIGGSDMVDCGAIEILGGKITAKGGYNSAGIGGSYLGRWDQITISGGEVTANGGYHAAGIGSGSCGLTSNKAKISITGGIVNATGGEYGAGIGSGNGEITPAVSNPAYCHEIKITGGSITATGGEKAAGIGTGKECSKCGDITITSGVTFVTATMGSGADHSIGMGIYDPSNRNTCGRVTIDGSTGQIPDSPYTYRP